MNPISNYYAYSEILSAGGQPTTDQLELLKKQGTELIINISPVSAKNALPDEHHLVEQLGMDYIHFPVDCANLRSEQYNTFRSLMTAAEGRKTFVHCGGNIKTSNLIHMFHVLEKGMEEAESLKVLRKIQVPEYKWFAYFKKMGMKGLEN
jgi:protein tyrosine phosphatase (PTP) superfamily phosphohydrolase (DUF442 family)